METWSGFDFSAGSILLRVRWDGSDSNTQSNADAYTNSSTDRNTNTDCNAHYNTYAHPYSNAYTDAIRAKRKNQCGSFCQCWG
jgi:hypothetical protein